jgi:hypothetical protein
MIRIPLLAITILAPWPLLAQSDHAIGVALRSPDAVVRVRGHSSFGLRIEAAVRGTASPPLHRFVRGYFDPAALASLADAVTPLASPVDPPADLYAFLRTPAVGTPLGDTIQFSRRSLGTSWDTSVVLRLVAVEGGSIEIPLTPAQISALFEGIGLEGGSSRFVPDSILASRASRASTRHRGVGSPPLIAVPPPRLRPPRGTPRGQVTLEFIVGVDGRPEPSTIEVIWADHDGLIPTAREATRDMRFTPSMVDGRPVRVTVRQVLRH